MVRILGWEIRRIRVDGAGYTCEACQGHDWISVERPYPKYEGVRVCSRCEAYVEVRRLLDLQYWRRFPEQVPTCINCGKSVPPEQITAAVCLDWYFCQECASNAEVLRRFEELLEKAST